jgi:hypothetical protein
VRARSLLLTANALGAGQAFDVALRKDLTLPAPPSDLRFDFQVMPVQIDTTNAAAIVLASIDFLDGTGDRYSVQLTIFQQGSAATVGFGTQSGFSDGGSSFTNQALPDPLAIGAWSSVRLEVASATAQQAAGRVFFNGTSEANVGLSLPFVPTALKVDLGASYETEPSLGWHLRFDNVLVTAL